MPLTSETDNTACTDDRSSGSTMTAVVQDRYGTVPEDVLRLAVVAVPAIGVDDVLVRVGAASVDQGTVHLMTGRPALMRLMGFGFRSPKASNPGRSLAGTVAAVGAHVTGFAIGDAVYGAADASFAEYARVRADHLAPMPANLTVERAGAVPISGLTALQAVRDGARVKTGQRVLVVGASGGVGTFAVQLAKHAGAEVTGVCSAAKAELVRSLGADHVLDYTTEDFTKLGVRYDAVIDIGGNTPIAGLRRALEPAGRLVIVGGETSGRWLGGFDRQIRALLLSPFVRQHLGALASRETAGDLVELTRLIEAGAMAPAVERVHPIGEVAVAVRHVQEGRARGKIVVSLTRT